MTDRSSSLALAFHRAIQIERVALYGTPNDLQLPLNLQFDARVPFLGFCGPSYEKGGVVLLAINPGGGGDAYTSRTPQDSELIPLIESFKAVAPADTRIPFESMCASYLKHAKTWNLWRILSPTLDACGTTAEQVCYLNLFPYRTANDARPSSRVLDRAWLEVVTPLLHALQPSVLVALGKKAGGVAQRYHQGHPQLFVVPRTIGDSYISPDARQVLDVIRQGASKKLGGVASG